MQVDYAQFVGRMINKYEGGYGWDRGDPGGPTKYGITCYDLAEHRGQKMTSMASWAPVVQAMTLAEAEDIYKVKYARYVNFDALPAGPDVVTLDYAVNSGIGRGVLVARALIGAHGSGPLTSAECALIGQYGADKFVDNMCDERLRFMHAIRDGSAWAEFGKGWGARVADLRGYGKHLAAGSTHETAPAAPDLGHVSTPKAVHVGKSATKPTVGGAGGAAVAAHQAGVSALGVALIVGGVLAAGIAYEIISERNAAKANATVHL